MNKLTIEINRKEERLKQLNEIIRVEQDRLEKLNKLNEEMESDLMKIIARPTLQLNELWRNNFIDDRTASQFGILELVEELGERGYGIESCLDIIFVEAENLEEVVEISEVISRFIFDNDFKTSEIIMKFGFSTTGF